jgi:hypothetical protein
MNESPADDPGVATPQQTSDEGRGNEPTRRTGWGSLAGLITLADDWDSPETNEQIARDFGLLPERTSRTHQRSFDEA